MTHPTISARSSSRSSSNDVAQRLERALDACEPHRRIVHKDERIYRDGDAFRAVYFVNSGFVKSVLVSEDGREAVTNLHLRGDLFGLDSIGSPRHGSEAVALDTGEVWEVPFERLMQEARHDSDLLRILYGAMSRELRDDRAWMLNASHQGAEQRLAGFLLELSDRYARSGYSARRLDLKLSRAEVGSHLGLTIETVSRCLSRMASEGLIAVCKRQIDILDYAGLREVACPGVTLQ